MSDDELRSGMAEAICDLLRSAGFDPNTDCVFIPSWKLREVIQNFFHYTKSLRSSGKGKGMSWLYNWKIPCLSKHNATKPYRGAIWRPTVCSSDQEPLLWDANMEK